MTTIKRSTICLLSLIFFCFIPLTSTGAMNNAPPGRSIEQQGEKTSIPLSGARHECLKATLSSDFSLFLPYINYVSDHGNSYFRATLTMVSEARQIYFEITDLAAISPPDKTCSKAVFSPDLTLFIPSIHYHSPEGDLEFQAMFETRLENQNVHFKLIDLDEVPPVSMEETTKFSMWTGPAKLRGANIWQSRNYTELHGEGTLGYGPAGPPYSQKDFNDLSALGANYVNISHPGLYTETPPYAPDTKMKENLDSLLDMIEKADMFAVITFRTGPGRSEFWSVFGEDTQTNPENGWFNPSYYNHTVWTNQEAQDAWGEMWRYTAEQYKNNSIVVGYDLMCEPNPGDVLLDLWEPDEFYPAYEGTSYDWNRFYPKIVSAIREKDSDTPILVQAMGYGAVAWLPFLETVNDAKTVYCAHQYEPFIYTHQAPGSLEHTYPGIFDTNDDGSEEQLNKTWLENLFSTIDDFSSAHNAPVTINEFGLQRWEPGADAYMKDIMDIMEQMRMNHALWQWSSSWEPFAWNNAFNIRYGAHPSNQQDNLSNALLQVIKANWSKNTLRPGNVTFSTNNQSGENDFNDITLKSTITSVQPMTGIVLWADNESNNTDAVQLEFAYLLYDRIVTEKGSYDWGSVDTLLDEIAGRKHQAILRFRFVYPGFETSVPAYIKSLPDYHETKGLSEGLETWFPDWSNEELQRFVPEFYKKFAERYQNDPRLAFLQTGFGLWAEYHIYDGPFELGKTFPSHSFQESFVNHLDQVMQTIPWSISIDAASEIYSPFSATPDLKEISFGLFDDSFMHENHGDYNAASWAFFGSTRYLSSPAGGEFSYYSQFDQENVLNETGMYDITFEEAASNFHISYMIGNDQPRYQSLERIKAAGLASGYKFEIISFRASENASVVEVKNTGTAPIYYDAFVAVNSIRSTTSLKLLAPGASALCRVASGGTSPVLTIESDHLVPGQKIEYNADL